MTTWTLAKLIPAAAATYSTDQFLKDTSASLVVLLISIPLCMGIAMAAGAPPIWGVVSGIIGGFVVGIFSGSPLRVTGPADSGMVLVAAIGHQFGLELLGLIVLMAGILQFLMGRFQLAMWFRAVSPTIIQAMLGGFGVLIFASQMHVLVDDKPRHSGLENLMSMPHVLHQISFADDSFHHQAALALGLATLFIYLAWQYWVPQRYRVVPGSLVAVVFGTVFAIWLDLPVNTIRIPDNVLSSLPVGEVFRHLDRLLDTHVWATILGLAMVCSAETLLDAIAIDKIVPGHRTNFNKDLMAQGLGNVLCGLLGAMPVSGVIVRSVANVNAGARTRVSTILLGLWLLVSVAFFPALLRMIPTASLAAILLYVSFKLMHFREIPKLARQGRSEMVIYAATLLTIVLHDPLGGVVVGLLLSLLKLLVLFSHLEIDVRQIDDGRERHITLYGVATFIRLPQLAATLDRLPNDADVHIHLEHVTYIDQACLELLENWEQAHQMQGGRLHICWETVDHRTASPILKLKRQLDAQEAGRLTRFA